MATREEVLAALYGGDDPNEYIAGFRRGARQAKESPGGLLRGLRNQAEWYGQLVAHPIDSVLGLLSAGKAVASNPSGAARTGLLAARDSLENAVKSQGNLWQFIGENTGPKGLISGLLALKAPAAVAAAGGLVGKISKEDILAKQAGKIPPPADLPRVPYTPARAPSEVDVADRIGTTGQYRGAPAGVDTPAKLGQLRTQYLNRMEQGEPGMYWYDRSSQTLLDLAGDRPGLADRAAGAAAVTSQGAGVPANAAFLAKGHNQAVLGAPVNTGRFPSSQSPTIEAIYNGSAVDPLDLGFKRGPFRENLSIAWNPNPNMRATNDIRQARAYGYVNKDGTPWDGGLGEAQHRFIDRQMDEVVDRANSRQLAGHTDWNNERAQAAAWVQQKAEEEGTSIADASRDFTDFLDPNTAHISTESMPGASTGHLPELLSASDADKLAYDQIQRGIFSDAKGRDRVAMEYNMLVRPTFYGPGYWQGKSNPSTQIPVLAGRVNPKEGLASMDPASQALIEAVGATHGLLRGQEGVGYNFFGDPGAPLAARAIAELRLGRPLTQEEMVMLGMELDKRMPGLLAPVVSPQGVRLLSFGNDGAAFTKLSKEMAKTLQAKDVQFAAPSSGLLGGDTFKPSDYVTKIDLPQYPRLAEAFDRIAPSLAQPLYEADTAVAKAMNATQGPMIQLLRKTIANEGIRGVQKLIKTGAIPAAVGATILAELSSAEPDDAA